MTWLDLARRVSVFCGFDLSEKELDHLLWEHTGFPGFWRSDDPVNECGRQIAEALR